MASKLEVVHSDQAILGGTPVFVGTRVPVKPLFDYLEAGDTLDESPGNGPARWCLTRGTRQPAG